MNGFDEEEVLHVVTLLESILQLTKWGLRIRAVVRDTSCGH